MALTLQDLEFLLTPQGQSLLSAELPDNALAAQKLLRKTCAPSQAIAVVAMRELRHRAAAADAKFPPPLAAGLLATDVLLQQASSLRTGLYKARRLAEQAGEDPVIDLCCGLGGDAIALALAGARVTACDRSPEAIFCATHNAALAGVGDRCRFLQADAADVDLPGAAVVHADPDRRAGNRRRLRLSDYSPDEAFLRHLPARTRAGALKLSPATCDDDLAGWDNVDFEYLSESGVCKQLVAWWPGRGHTRATVLSGPLLDPAAESIDGGRTELAEIRTEPGAFLIEPDPAVLAGQAVDNLARRLGLWRIAPGLEWLFANAPPTTTLARCFRILRATPGRQGDIARALADLDAGVVEVKPRGVTLDTDKMQRSLRGRGSRTLTVLWGRADKKEIAFLAEPVAR